MYSLAMHMDASFLLYFKNTEFLERGLSTSHILREQKNVAVQQMGTLKTIPHWGPRVQIQNLPGIKVAHGIAQENEPWIHIADVGSGLGTAQHWQF